MATPTANESYPLTYNPNVTSDLAFGLKDTHPSGVLFLSDSTRNRTPYQFWLEARELFSPVCAHFAKQGFDTFSFTPYSSREAFEQFHPRIPLQSEPIVRPASSKPADVSQSPIRQQRQNPPTSPPLFTRRQDATTDAPAPAPSAAPTDPMHEIFRAFMEESKRSNDLQQQQIALLRQQQQQAAQPPQITVTTPTDSRPTFPTWNGSSDKQPFFAHALQNMKQHTFFSSVTDWSQNDGNRGEQATWLREEMFKKLPESKLHKYLYDPKFEDGFKMLADLEKTIDPDSLVNKARSLDLFANMELKDKMTGQQLLALGRSLAFGLKNIDIDSLVAMRCIKAMQEAERYDGIVDDFRKGNKDVVGCSLEDLGKLVQSADDRMGYLTPSASDTPSANRGTRQPTPRTPAKSPSPNPNPTPPNMAVAYPPVRGVKWSSVQDVLDKNKQCPICYSWDDFHVKVGCPCLASKGKVIVSDAAKAKAVKEKFDAHKARATPAARQATASAPAPPPPPVPGDQGGSARRATSTERQAAGDVPPPVPPSDPASTNRFAPLQACSYVDNEEIPSDPDDDAEFDHDFCDPHSGSNNLNADVAPYLPSARRATARHVSSTLSSIATSTLSTHHRQISKPSKSSSKKCCADSGATDHMFPDKASFLSYHPTPGKFIKLGDNTTLPQLGIGTVKVMLNGKIILLRNVLHVPGLHEPLYSLRRHRELPGCGYFSSYDTGSHLLFPHFVLEVDTSVDNLLSYESIGSSKCSRLDYAEPRVHPSARPAHLIPPEESNEMLSVQFAYSPPKTIPTSALPAPSSPPSPSPSPTPSPADVVPSDDELIVASAEPLSSQQLAKIHHNPSELPPIPPSYTPGPAETRTTFSPLKLHRIMACRHFRNQQHLIAASANAKLIKSGELPVTLGDFATMNKPNKGKTLTKSRKYLDKVHLDIVFGDCLSLGNYRYALVFVDVATRYCWVYGMQALTSNEIISCFTAFTSDAHGTPKTFHTDFDKKLIGGKALKWIQEAKSRIIASPSNRQSSNGLVERTWQTLVRMARAYITEKQVGREYWYFAIKHAAHMANQIPGRLGRKLTSPFELVYGSKPDSSTWFELFSVGFFRHSSDEGESKTKMQAQTLDGIAVGRDDQTNTIIFYNPLTKQYYRPPIYKLDEGRLPISCFPKSIRFDGGLSCGLLRNRAESTPEPFPPGTRIVVSHEGASVKGTISNIPLPFLDTSAVTASDADADQDTKYTILLDSGVTIEKQFHELAPSLTNFPSTELSSAPSTSPFDSLPVILQRNSKITFDHQGAFHKGYLDHTPEGGFMFVSKRSASSKKILWSVPLPEFSRQWYSMVGENIIIPGHSTVSTFLRPNSSNNAPSAKHVSAKNLINPCPPSLLKALHPSNPDRQVWLDSYMEEKGGLESLNVYEKVNKKTYLQLRRSGRIGKALPSMCVLVVKHDKDGNPVRAKSRIVVLGNFEDRIYDKSQRYAPVLKYSSLRLLLAKAVRAKRVLQQGDCKNAFCNAELPEDELTVVRPPVGDPGYSKDEYWLLKKTLYGLRRSPHHWYNMITDILKNIGLQPSPHDPCLYSGVITSPLAPSDLPQSSRKPVHVGIYVDDFVFFSEDSVEEENFKKALGSCSVPIDWMGTVDYFLGTAFNWKRHEDGHLSVLLTQSAFTEYTAHRFAIDRLNPVPNMTPYRSGMPIDAIPPPDPKDPDLKRRTKCYQGIVGCINWLATCTRPDVAPALTFLASSSTRPSHQHYKAALHVLKYLYSTSEYGISFHSNANQTLQAFNHFPHHHDKEAYTDATPPSPAECHQLTAFSDACWGGQFGNAVPDGTPLELYKFRSLSGYIICCAGGPIAWKAIRQDKTANSSCVAEINATHECVNDLLSVKHRAQDLGFPDASQRIPVYNDNKAAVDWASSVTLKGTKHINLHENCVREAHQGGIVQIKHIPGVINSSDLFTKEIKDDAHFRRCRDTFMVSKSNFFAHGHCMPSHMTSRDHVPYYNMHSNLSPEAYARKRAPSGPSQGPAITASAARTVSDRPTSSHFERGVLMTSHLSTKILSGLRPFARSLPCF